MIVSVLAAGLACVAVGVAVWLATRRVYRQRPAGDSGGRPLTDDELRALLATHGSLTADDRRLIDKVFTTGVRSVREVMRPRTEVEFLDDTWTVARAWKTVSASTYSRFPVFHGSYDDVRGFVHVRDLAVMPVTQRRTTKVAEILRPVRSLPATNRALVALSELRHEGHHLAIVVDEYGGTAGIVTLEDLIEELVGDIRDEYDVEARESRMLHGGDVEVDGLLNLDEFAEAAGFDLPDGPYETAAGFVVAALGQVPSVGDVAEYDGHRLEVTLLDGRRIDRLRVTRRPAPVPDNETSTDTADLTLQPEVEAGGEGLSAGTGAAVQGAARDERAVGADPVEASLDALLDGEDQPSETLGTHSQHL